MGRLGVAFVIPEINIKIAKMVNEGISGNTGDMLEIVLAVQ